MNIGEMKEIVKDLDDNQSINVHFDVRTKKNKVEGKKIILKPNFRWDNHNGQLNLRLSSSVNELINISEEVIDNAIIRQYFP